MGLLALFKTSRPFVASSGFGLLTYSRAVEITRHVYDTTKKSKRYRTIISYDMISYDVSVSFLGQP
jgi:hypothetical protein